MIDAIASEAARPRRTQRFGVHTLRMGFRTWRRSRPFWAGFWALLGGLPMWYFPSKAVQFLFVSRTPIWAGILVGVLVESFGLLLWFTPQSRALLGTLIVIFSMLSFITSDFGGLFVGMLLGILGGSMALAWMPLRPKVQKKHRLFHRRTAAIPLETTAETTFEQPQIIVLPEEEPVAEAEEMPIEVVLAETPPSSIDLTQETAPQATQAGPEERAPAIDLTQEPVEAEDLVDLTAGEAPSIDLAAAEKPETITLAEGAAGSRTDQKAAPAANVVRGQEPEDLPPGEE